MARLIHRIIKNSDIMVIKFIQWLSMRPDIINKQLYQLFSTYKDNYPSHSYEYTRRKIDIVYGRGIDQMFSQFDKVPIASASIAQVYKAKMAGQSDYVAVKIKHPHVDIGIVDYREVLAMVLRIANKFFKIRINVDLDMFYKSITAQANLYLEGTNAEIFADIYKKSHIIVPRVISKNTDILIYSFESSTKFTDYCNSHTYEEQKIVIKKFIALTYASIFLHNKFHADIHDANWGVNESGKIVLYDYGFIKDINGRLIRNILRSVFSKDHCSIPYLLLNEQDEFQDNLHKIKKYKITDFKMELDCHSNAGIVKNFLDIMYDIHIVVNSSILSYLINMTIVDLYSKKYGLDNLDGDFSGETFFQNLIDGTEMTMIGDDLETLVDEYSASIDYLEKFEYIKRRVAGLYDKMVDLGYTVQSELKDIIMSMINIVLLYERLKETDIVDMINYVEKRIGDAGYAERVNRTNTLFNKYNNSMYFLLKLQKFIMNKTENYDIANRIIDGYVESDILKNIDEMICLFDDD